MDISQTKKIIMNKMTANSPYTPAHNDFSKENKEILSQELVDYYKESGSLEIEDADGNVKRMKFSVTLVS